jgi:hypothetical protein
VKQLTLLLPIPCSKVRYSNFDLHGQGGFNATAVRGFNATAVICVIAGLAAVAIGFGLNSATSKSTTEISISNPTPTPAISISEIHNQAHIEFLPVQQIEDLKPSFRCAASLRGRGLSW